MDMICANYFFPILSGELHHPPFAVVVVRSDYRSFGNGIFREILLLYSKELCSGKEDPGKNPKNQASRYILSISPLSKYFLFQYAIIVYHSFAGSSMPKAVTFVILEAF